VPRPERLVDRGGRALSHRLASAGTRRGFLATVAALTLGLIGTESGGAKAVRRRPVRGANRTRRGWYGFCGHTWTTGSCPTPFTLPRIDTRGYPVRPADGRPVDNLGRLIDAMGRPVAADGTPLMAPDGAPLARAPRTRVCEEAVRERYGIDVVIQGAWYRCCGGQIRKLVDCCTTTTTRINGDAALVGYCRPGRRVFCVLYIDTAVPC
jgi:hypothetical protein